MIHRIGIFAAEIMYILNSLHWPLIIWPPHNMECELRTAVLGYECHLTAVYVYILVLH